MTHKLEIDSLLKPHKPDKVFTLQQYLTLASKDSTLYANVYERLLKALGKPKIIDTRTNERLRILESNSIIKQYDVLHKNLFGINQTLEKIVSFLTFAAQGLEEANQIMYLYGPVGSAKSTIVEILKTLIQQEPVYVLMYQDEISPVFESPLGLFSVEDSEKLNIPVRYLTAVPSPWAIKRLDEAGGTFTDFKVMRTYPNILRQVSVCKIEAGDENNADITTLVGKTKLRALGDFAQSDPDSYDFSGGLCRANQGVMDFVEMLKTPRPTLLPLLTAVQEHNYKGTEALSAIPFTGLVIAHSNESDWDEVRQEKSKEALIDRMYPIAVPYNLQLGEEVLIYKKLLRQSSLSTAPIAPTTLENLAKFACFTRIDPPEENQGSPMSKLRVYNGEIMRKQDPTALSFQQYKDKASKREGFDGISTRLTYKILAKTFNYDVTEVAADPIVLLSCVLEDVIKEEHLDSDTEERYIDFIRTVLLKDLQTHIEKTIKSAYLEHYNEYGQNWFDSYILKVDLWEQGEDFIDKNTGQQYDREDLDTELKTLEKAAGIFNSEDFRHEVLHFCLRYRARHGGDNPNWRSYEPLKEVIEKGMFKSTDQILPIISVEEHNTAEDKQKYKQFLDSMLKQGYTAKQVKRMVEWYKIRKINH